LKAVYDVTGAGTTAFYTHKSDSCGSRRINDELKLVINTEGRECCLPFVPDMKIYIDSVKIS
jgi:hypothetical protein